MAPSWLKPLKTQAQSSRLTKDYLPAIRNRFKDFRNHFDLPSEYRGFLVK
jgi:hypothetical protein